MQRTRPDFVAYVPRHYDGSTGDSLNEHFLVFDGPDGSLMAVWTQAGIAVDRSGGRQHNRAVFSRSRDEGVTWAPPRRLAGPGASGAGEGAAAWAFPMVAPSGRVYVVYSRHTGASGWIEMHTGVMECVYSDDRGQSWSLPQRVPFPRSPYDDPDQRIPPEWIVWQRPMRDLEGGRLVGYTRWVSKPVAALKDVRGWTEIESVCEFMRFTNVDATPEPADLELEFGAWGEEALRVPHYRHPLLSIAQEPSLVRLPDDRLLCVMRTCTGYIWWSQSCDDGRTWCSPRPLLDRDFGRPLLNPVAPAPIYRLSDGRYAIFYSNNGGDIGGPGASDAGPRRPCHVAVGEFREGADQPVWFSEPRVLMDTDDYGVDGVRNSPETPRNSGLSLYSSFTTRHGADVLWYPDRKFFLLGKRITPQLLEGLHVPRQ